MAEAYKCDRCGEFYDKNKKVKSKGRVPGENVTGIVTIRGVKNKRFDLCDDCITAFKDFMKGRKVDNIER